MLFKRIKKRNSIFSVTLLSKVGLTVARLQS